MNLNFELPLIAAVASLGVAVFGLCRSRSGVSSWSAFFGLIALSIEALFAALGAQHGVSLDSLVRWQGQRMVAAGFVPGAWLLFSLTFARGNAEEFVRKWRWAVVSAFVVPVALATLGYRLLIYAVLRGSLAHSWIFALGSSGLAVELVILAGSVLILMNLERTWRASVGTMRWRIKFMLMGAGLIFVVRGFTTTQALLFRVVDPALGELDSGALVVAAALMVRSLRRTVKGEVDVYPSKSVIQGSVTVLLAGIYLLIVGACARILAKVAGENLFALEALLILVALAVLVILFQSDRLRLRLATFVSRHFQRPLYDYRTVWLRFTEGTASQVDQAELCRSLVKLVADVFHCLSVSLWIVDDQQRRLNLAASTALAESAEAPLTSAELAALLEHFKRQPVPLPFAHAPEALSGPLRRLHPNKFRRQENRVCLAMSRAGETIALLLAGDRVEGEVFSTQDLDMLKCVGDHATASLLNLRLAHKLVQAREMQAFQTMAAFFVHDLKNAASTLSIMLQNLPVHFDDPEFRKDALRGVNKSVQHINHVIGRLSLLRHELKLAPRETDLNELLVSTLAPLEAPPQFTVARDLGPLPPIRVDADQIGKVVTNLVINAREAMNGRGEARVSSRADDGWAVIAVADTGCGMSPDFISQSLFRPFQTTKKSGLGIGMFQSKMVIEMHGGRISVQSESGVGTTFVVQLPLGPTPA